MKKLFKKIAVMPGKGVFSKTNGNLCNVPILPRLAHSSGLSVVKLRRDLRYRGCLYLEPLRPCAINGSYLKSHKFYKDIATSKGLPTNEKLTFSEVEPVEKILESYLKMSLKMGYHLHFKIRTLKLTQKVHQMKQLQFPKYRL